MKPSASVSKSRRGSELLGAGWYDAGPANAVPVRGSYMLPWQGHSPLILPSSGQYFHTHHK